MLGMRKMNKKNIFKAGAYILTCTAMYGPVGAVAGAVGGEFIKALFGDTRSFISGTLCNYAYDKIKTIPKRNRIYQNHDIERAIAVSLAKCIFHTKNDNKILNLKKKLERDLKNGNMSAEFRLDEIDSFFSSWEVSLHKESLDEELLSRMFSGIDIKLYDIDVVSEDVLKLCLEKIMFYEHADLYVDLKASLLELVPVKFQYEFLQILKSEEHKKAFIAIQYELSVTMKKELEALAASVESNNRKVLNAISDAQSILILKLDRLSADITEIKSYAQESNQLLRSIQEKIEHTPQEKLVILPGKSDIFEERPEAYQDIKKLLGEYHHLNVTAIGGVGKSEICKQFIHKETSYQNRLWINYKGDLTQSLLSIYEFEEYLKANGREGEDQESKYKVIMSKLKSLSGKSLIVIDNFDKVKDPRIKELLQFNSNVHILMTSRISVKFDIIKKYELSFLDKKSCFQMFVKYYEKDIKETMEINALNDVIDMTGNHTLTLELLAKLAKSEYLKVSRLLQLLHKEGFTLSSLSVKLHANRDDDNEEEIIYEQLKKVFNISGLSEEQYNLLRRLCVLPNMPIAIQRIREIFDLIDMNSLNELINRGWIQLIKEEDQIQAHRVITQLLRMETKPDEEICLKLVDVINIELSKVYNRNELYVSKCLLEEILESFAFSETGCMYLLDTLVTVCYRYADYNSTVLYCENVTALRKKVFGEVHMDTIASLNNLAIFNSVAGKYINAIEFTKKVVDLRTRIQGEEHPDTIEAMVQLAAYYIDAGKIKEATELSEKVNEFFQIIVGMQELGKLRAMDSLSNVFSRLGRHIEAFDLSEMALNLKTSMLGEEHPDTIRSMQELSNRYGERGRAQDSLALSEKILELRNRLLGEEHPDTISAMNNLSIDYMNDGRAKEALELSEKVLELSNRILGEEHPNTITAMYSLSMAYEGVGKPEEALELSEKVLELSKRILGEEHPVTIRTISLLSNSYNDSGKFKEGLELAEKALELMERVLGKEHPDTINAMYHLSVHYACNSRDKEAIALLEEMLAISIKVLGEEHRYTVRAKELIHHMYQRIEAENGGR